MTIEQYSQELKNVLNETENVLICLQKGNDLDTMASALAMAKLLEINQPNIKQIRILQINVEKTVLGNIKKYFYWPNENLTGKKTIFMTVDINVKEQILEPIYEIAAKCGKVMRIDHHEDFESLNHGEYKFNEINLVLPEYSSCCEIIWKIAKILKWERNQEIVNILFNGLYGDSKNLIASSVNSETFANISELYKEGAEVKKIMRALNTQPIRDLHIVADLIKEAQTEKNLVILNLNPEIVYKYYPGNLKMQANRRIRQKKLLTFPLNIIEFILKINTIVYIHYSLISPFNSKKKFIFIVLVKPNPELEQILLANDFKKHRNRFSRKIDFSEILKLLEENKKIFCK